MTGGEGTEYIYTLNTLLPTQSTSGPQTSNVFNALTDDRVSDLQRTYGIDYWITSSENTTSFPVVYANGNYKIVKLSTPQN